MKYKIDIQLLLLFLILALATFLRFYRLPEMASFDFDQEYAANFAYSVLKEYPIQFIGQGLSIEGLFMGPLYFYYLVPFFFFSNLHPLGGFAGSALLGITIVAAYFFVGKSLFGTTVGLIAAFIRAILFNGLLHDWAMTPAYSSELLVLLTWWIFYKYWGGQVKYLPLLGLIFGLYTSIHPILFPFYLVFLALLLIKRRLPNFKTLALSFATFLIPILPLIIFEFFHQFWEVRTLISFFNGASGGGLHYPSLYFKFNIAEFQRILSFQFIPAPTFLIIFLAVFFLLVIKQVGFWKRPFHSILLPITYLTFLLYYSLFPKKVPEYYFLALTSLALLYTAATLSLLKKSKTFLVVLALIIINITYANFQQIWERWNSSSLITLANKDYIVKEIVKRQPKDQEFFVSYIKYPGWNTGFDYLFKLYGQIPQTREASPPVYSIVIPKFLSPGNLKAISGNIGLILPE